MRILLFGGTTEGRELARELSERGLDVTVSVATELGAEELRDIPGISVRMGRMEPEEMAELLKGYDFCVDATHPYAEVVSKNIRTACAAAEKPLRRLLREASETEGCLRVNSCAEAAQLLAEQEGSVLVATGSKELRTYAGIDPNRLYVRVLPTHEALDICEELKIPHSHILAMQGPFTRKMNEAMLEQYGIRWMVSKDGGKNGGFAEKLEAARSAGAQLVLVERPEDTGVGKEELINELCGR